MLISTRKTKYIYHLLGKQFLQFLFSNLRKYIANPEGCQALWVAGAEKKLVRKNLDVDAQERHKHLGSKLPRNAKLHIINPKISKWLILQSLTFQGKV